MLIPDTYTDAAARATLSRAMRLVGILAIVGAPVAWLRGGWASAVLLLVGAAISASGLWEWRRLMAALMARMEDRPSEAVEAERLPELSAAARPPSLGFAIAGFTLRMLLVLAFLYVSLSYLHGSALALAAGLAMGVAALTFEAIRLLRNGTL